MIGALSLRGMSALMTVEGGTNTEVFQAYFEQVLLPELHPGDVVVWDNLAAHKNPRILEAARNAGVIVKFLPPYSPDLSPIELAWSLVKRVIKAKKARDREALDKAYAEAAAGVTPEHARAWFGHCERLAQAA
jgi:transposase